MPRERRAAYDSEIFRKMWFSTTTAREIAQAFNVTPAAILKAAARRGFPGKHFINAMRGAE